MTTSLGLTRSGLLMIAVDSSTELPHDQSFDELDLLLAIEKELVRLSKQISFHGNLDKYVSEIGRALVSLQFAPMFRGAFTGLPKKRSPDEHLTHIQKLASSLSEALSTDTIRTGAKLNEHSSGLQARAFDITEELVEACRWALDRPESKHRTRLSKEINLYGALRAIVDITQELAGDMNTTQLRTITRGFVDDLFFVAASKLSHIPESVPIQDIYEPLKPGKDFAEEIQNLANAMRIVPSLYL